VATWAIVGSQLMLRRIEGLVDPAIDLPAAASWFSGSLILQRGEVVGYDSDNGRLQYEHEIQLAVRGGQVVSSAEQVNFHAEGQTRSDSICR
jgi:hypothetical protein